MQGALMSGSREETIVGIRAFDQHAIFDVAWLLNREKGLRGRLQQTLKQNAALEARVQALEKEREKLGIAAPVMRKPSQVEPKQGAVEELRDLSKEFALEGAMDDAFNESEWYEDDDLDVETAD